MIPLVPVLFGLSVVLLTDPDIFNQIFDVIVPIYTVLAVAFIIYHYKRTKDIDGEEIDDRVFTFVKDSAPDLLPWQTRFLGKFEKTERKNFGNWLMFNGISSFIARMTESASFTQYIDQDPKCKNKLNIWSTGVPPFTGVWMECNASFEASPFVEFLDTNSRRMQMKIWWNAELQQLHTHFLQHYKDGSIMKSDQYRKFLEDDTLFHEVKNIKQDGTSCTFEEYLKRVA